MGKLFYISVRIEFWTTAVDSSIFYFFIIMNMKKRFIKGVELIW